MPALLVLEIVQFPFAIDLFHREGLKVIFPLGLNVYCHLISVRLLADDVEPINPT